MRLLIIEDEDAAVRRLRKLLSQVDPDLEILGSLDSVAASVEWLETHPVPDLILMDIHLADGASFEIFKLTQVTCPVVFTTAYDQYALDAFRVNAIDYLLKPIKEEDLKRALSRLREKSGSNAREEKSPSAKELMEKLDRSGLLPTSQRTLVKIGQTIKILDLNTAAYFYSQDKMTFSVSADGKRYPIDATLEQLDNRLDQTRFFRINRQLIICIDAIEEMYTYSKSRVKIKLNPPLTQGEAIVSTERSPHFKKWLTGEES